MAGEQGTTGVTGDAGNVATGDNKENIDTGFIPGVGNVWELPKELPNNGQQQNNNNNNVNPMEGFDAHVSKLDFGFNLGKEQLENLVRSGDATGLTQAINTAMQQSYRRAMLDVAAMVARNSEQTKNSAVADATQTYQSKEAIKFLENAIPIAKDVNVAPIAQAIYQRRLNAGRSQEQAVDDTKAFLNKMRGAKETDLGLPKTPPSSSQMGRGVSRPTESDEDMMDWIKFGQS